MNSLNSIAQRLRDVAHTCETAGGGIHPVMLGRIVRKIPTDLHTCANNLYRAANCGIGPDGDITLALALATAHIEHTRGDLAGAQDHLLEALAYVERQRMEVEA